MILKRKALIQSIREAQTISVNPEYIADYIMTRCRHMMIMRDIPKDDKIIGAVESSRYIQDIGLAVYNKLCEKERRGTVEIATINYLEGD